MPAETITLGRPTPCKSCRAPMLWATTSTGKAMPMDADPVAGADWVIEGATIRRATADDDHAKRYVSHFVTCPFSAVHRKTKTRSKK